MVLGWPLIFGSAALLYLRWNEVDEVYLIAAVALTPFLAIPLLPASIIAWFSRSKLLRVATAIVVGVYLFTVAPFDAAVGCRPDRAHQAITIMTANVFIEGGDPVAIADQVRTVNPDILIMQESNSGFLQIFDEQPELDAWVYRSHSEPNARRGVVVWSKWPMIDVEFGTLSLYQSLTTTVVLPEVDVVVAAVHTTSPTDRDGIDAWNREFDTLSDYRADGPTIMAGDFNATEDHAPFRHLLDQGWTDVHDNKGCGLDQTWPTDTLPFPVMRLDHVLVSDDFDVLSTDVTKITGSDHLSVVSKIKPVSR